jgi:hypothetical protein
MFWPIFMPQHIYIFWSIWFLYVVWFMQIKIMMAMVLMGFISQGTLLNLAWWTFANMFFNPNNGLYAFNVTTFHWDNNIILFTNFCHVPTLHLCFCKMRTLKAIHQLQAMRQVEQVAAKITTLGPKHPFQFQFLIMLFPIFSN